MTEHVNFFCKLKENEGKWVESSAENQIITVIPDDQVEEIRKTMSSWQKIDDAVEPDSDNESDFDEELLPIVSYDDEFNETNEFYQRVSKCLQELEQLQTEKNPETLETLDAENAEEIEEWQTFDVSSPKEIRQLRCVFLKKHPESVFVEPKKLKSRFEAAWPSIVMKKSKNYANLSNLFVVFRFHCGCCSCSSVPMKIFKKLEHAQRHAKKIHNAAQAAFSKNHGGHGNSSPDRPEIFEFKLEDDKFVCAQKIKVLLH